MIEGLAHYPRAADAQYRRLALGVAWPAARPGFAVVVGEHLVECAAGLPRLDVLDEAAEPRLWELVVQTAALRQYYHPELVTGDGEHAAAAQFVSQFAHRGLVLEHSLLCSLRGPCGYAFPILARLIAVGRLLVPPASRLAGELLTAPAHEDLAELKLSDYPAIAALAFAVLGLELSRADRHARPTQAELPRRVLG